MQIWFPISMSSPTTRLISAETVTMDEADMLMRRENQPGQLMQEEKK